MRRKFYWLLLLLLGLPNLAVATREICGPPPPDQFKEENSESIKGELAGKANLLSSYVGKAELGGKIEAARQEIFAKYPDANAAYLDRYFAYMFCFVIFDPKNQQNPDDKSRAIKEFKRQQQPQSSIDKPRDNLAFSIEGLAVDWSPLKLYFEVSDINTGIKERTSTGGKVRSAPAIMFIAQAKREFYFSSAPRYLKFYDSDNIRVGRSTLECEPRPLNVTPVKPGERLRCFFDFDRSMYPTAKNIRFEESIR